MASPAPALDSTDLRITLALDSYRRDHIRLVDPSLRGFTHILSSRQGLFALNEQSCKLIAHGLFFGITFRDDALFLFEACNLPRATGSQGRILRFTLRDDRIVDTEILLKGLDNGCHGIDFLDGRLHIVDTYNQTILRAHPDLSGYETLHPLPRLSERGTGPAYVHCNSILQVPDSSQDRILLLLHHGARPAGPRSEIAVYTPGWQPLERIPLAGSGCHNLALLEDGTLLTCGSMEGNLISPSGLRVHISPHLTRGLAVGTGSIAVGASELVEREGRLRNAGTVTFLDPDLRIRTVLPVPAAPTELRRLDAQDRSLSTFLRTTQIVEARRSAHTT